MMNKYLLPAFEDWVLGRRFAPRWDRRTRILAVLAAVVAGVWLGGATP